MYLKKCFGPGVCFVYEDVCKLVAAYVHFNDLKPPVVSEFVAVAGLELFKMRKEFFFRPVKVKVALDQIERRRLSFQKGEKLFPELTVFDRLLCRVFPPVLLPLYIPLAAEAVHQIGAVGKNIKGKIFLLKAFQSGDESSQFHAVVSGVNFTAMELLPMLSEFEDAAPAAYVVVILISGASSVSIDVYCLHSISLIDD